MAHYCGLSIDRLRIRSALAYKQKTGLESTLLSELTERNAITWEWKLANIG